MPKSAFASAKHSDDNSLADQLISQKSTEIDDLIAAGWTIKIESGRQLILHRNGKTVTRYRPKE